MPSQVAETTSTSVTRVAGLPTKKPSPVDPYRTPTEREPDDAWVRWPETPKPLGLELFGMAFFVIAVGLGLVHTYLLR
jgi:hypothetical protein